MLMEMILKKKKNQQTIFSFYENEKLKENVLRIS
jgi:hypothetical protein